jgi:hypothetical protein
MRTSMAYFAGVGTVIAAVGAGLSGGYFAANITNPPTPGVSKLERRMSAEPITVATAPAERVPHAAATETTNPAPAPVQEPPQTQAAAPAVDATPAEEKPANNVAAAQPVQTLPQPSKPVEQADEKSAGPRDTIARARDADIKRADVEKRRAERRQQWADKRRLKQPREQELEAVEERVREVTEPRRIRIREEGEPRSMFAAEPARSETRGIRLFGQDD